jgi:uncharacterized repeat protein (TIGR01451 family)
MKSFLSYLRRLDDAWPALAHRQASSGSNRGSKLSKSILILRGFCAGRGYANAIESTFTTVTGLGLIFASQYLGSTTAQAAPTPLSLKQSYLGHVDYRVTGGTLRTQPNPIDPCAVTTTSSGVLSAVPPGATIKNAYLYWSDSQDSKHTGTVSFQGENITAQKIYSDSKSLGSTTGYFYGNVADVTSIVNTNRNATYTFKNLNFSKSPTYCKTQTVLGAWGLIVVYEDPAITDYRYLNLYEGFVLSQKQVVNFTVDKIKVATNPVAYFTFLGWEGDATLAGELETLKFNGSVITNSLNPNTQQFNSTITSPPAQGLNLSNTFGVDLDTYDVHNYIAAGATSAIGTVSTGQDMVIQQAALVSVSTEVADLELTQTVSNPTPAANTNVTFTITLTNKGPNNPTGVKVIDSLPTGLTFVSATPSVGTYNASTGIWDLGAATAVASGTTKTLTIVAKVNQGGTIANTAQISASGLPDLDSTPNNSIATEDDQATVSITSTAPVITDNRITGTVFEDVNYGGGAGRNLTASSGKVISGAKVELYTYQSKTYLDGGGSAYFYATSALTDGNGKYTFANLAANSKYLVRVVNSTVNSTRSGSDGTELGIQTFRADGATGSVVELNNEVGGRIPAIADNANASSTDYYINPTNGLIKERTWATSVYCDLYSCYSSITGDATDVNIGYAQSLTEVMVNSSSVSGVDFGYNFDTIVNKNATGQGSLSQFVANSNLLGDESSLAQAGKRKGVDGVTDETLPKGKETSIFMIPDGAAHPGFVASASSGPASQLTGTVASIPLSGNLLLTGANANNTNIDGTTQTVNIGNSNAVGLGTGGTVGVEGLALSKVQGPEVVLTGNGAGAVTIALGIYSHDVTVRGMGLYGFGYSAYKDNSGDITVLGGNNATIEQNIIGSSPITALAAPTQSSIGINISGGNNGTIQNNLIGQTVNAGISISSTGYAATAADGWQIQNNELFGAANGDATSADGLTVGQNTGKFTVRGNLIRNQRARAIDLFPTSSASSSSSSGWTIENNTIDTNGQGTTQSQGMLLSVKETTKPSLVTNNIIKGNKGAGIGVADGSTVQKIKISQNSFRNNGGNAIDLSANGTATTPISDKGISLNGSNKILGTAGATACGYVANKANQRIDYPLFNKSKLVGTTLTVTGQACPNSQVEIYQQDTTTVGDINGSNQYGEGAVYLGTLTTDNGGFFGGDIVVGTKLVAADRITSIAIDPSGNTSEFNNGIPVNTTGIDISGYLYTHYAANGNFTLDPTEPHLGSGVTVQLLNGATVVNTTTTDANGYYKFPDVTDGVTYTISVAPTVDDLTAAANGTAAGNTRSLTIPSGSTTDVTGQDFGYSFPNITAVTCTATNGNTFAGTPNNQILAFNLTTGGSIVATTTTLAADTSALAHNQANKLVYYAQGGSIYAWDYIAKTHAALTITDPTSAGTTLTFDGVPLNANGGGMGFAQNATTGEIYLGVGNVDAAGQQFGLYRLKLDATGKIITKISKIDLLTMAGKAANFSDDWGDLVVTGSGDVYGVTAKQGFWKFNLTTGGFTTINAALAGVGKSLFLSDGKMYLFNSFNKAIQEIDPATGTLVGLSATTKAVITDGSECGANYASELKIVQRITKINTTDVTTVNVTDSAPAASAVANWTVPNFLRGQVSGSVVKSGDIVEYTTYFTSNGTAPTGATNICSLIPKEAEFLRDGYGEHSGMQVTFIKDDGTTAFTQILSNDEDNDGGVFVNKHRSASGSCLTLPSLNGSLTSTENAQGAVTVNLVKSGGTLPDPAHNRPKQGFIRFKVKVR